MLFEDLDLNLAIIRALHAQQYIKPTPIQEQALMPLLQGRDLLGCADTGTGKTAAFAIPILEALSKEVRNEGVTNPIKALILAPTRELVIQIGESFETYGKYLEIPIGVIYGGITPKRHIKVLKREPCIVVATPGRLLDMVKQGYADLSHVEYFVLDEADRMLDIGMKKDVKAIIDLLPQARQNMLFSATMPEVVTQLVNGILKNPVKIEVKSKNLSEKNIKHLGITQQVYFIEEPDKTEFLIKLLQEKNYGSVLVFVRTKKIADRISKAVNLVHIRAKAIHSDKNQSERQKVMALFKEKAVRVLVATDLAARGIDIDKLSLVVNMNVPTVPETYIHRIGRTGRAGKVGTAITLCSSEEVDYLKEIELLEQQVLERVQ